MMGDKARDDAIQRQLGSSIEKPRGIIYRPSDGSKVQAVCPADITVMKPPRMKCPSEHQAVLIWCSSQTDIGLENCVSSRSHSFPDLSLVIVWKNGEETVAKKLQDLATVGLHYRNDHIKGIVECIYHLTSGQTVRKLAEPDQIGKQDCGLNLHSIASVYSALENLTAAGTTDISRDDASGIHA